jgi:prevent-host-death family protein
MSQVTLADLKADAEEILQHVQADGEPVDVVRDGRVVASIMPAQAAPRRASQRDNDLSKQEPRPLTPEEREQFEAAKRIREELAKRIARSWPKGVSAVDAVREGRRGL